MLKVHFNLVGCLSLFMALSLGGCSINPASEANLTGRYSDIQSSSLIQGQVPPDFSLPDANGAKVSLAETLENHHVLLIFYRGDWCPYCIDQFSTIQPVLPELIQHNVKLLAISPDQQTAAMNTQRQFGQDYVFLSDTDMTVANLYGVNSGDALPHPATLLIKKAQSIAESEIVWLYVSQDHKTRPTGTQLLGQVKRLFEKK